MQPISKRQRLLAFVPAAVLIGVVAGTAAGIGIVPAATATNIDITGSVDATINTPANPPSGPGVNDGGTDSIGQRCTASGPNASFSIAAGWETTARITGACRIAFGASNGPIQLTYENGLAGGTNSFYCNHVGGGARSCATAASRVDDVDLNGTLDANEIGIALVGVDSSNGSGDATAAATVTLDSAPAAGDAIWRPVPPNDGNAATGPAALCQTTVAGDGSCDFVIGVRGAGGPPAQNTGIYSGQLLLTATQL